MIFLRKSSQFFGAIFVVLIQSLATFAQVNEIHCSNGRKDTDSKGNVICICDESYFGPFCTERKPCKHGRYINNKCECDDYHQGEECRLPICENGHLLLGTAICACDPGYMGEHCELCHPDYERIDEMCRQRFDNRNPFYPTIGTSKSDRNGQNPTVSVALTSPAAIGGIIAGVIGLCAVMFGCCAWRKRQTELANVGGGLEHQESFPGTYSKNRISSFLDTSIHITVNPSADQAENGINDQLLETHLEVTSDAENCCDDVVRIDEKCGKNDENSENAGVPTADNGSDPSLV